MSRKYELNPNHPVTKAVHDHWHKIAALLLIKFSGGKEVVITVADISQMAEAYEGHAIVCHDGADGLHLRMVGPEEAEMLARKEGGLPV